MLKRCVKLSGLCLQTPGLADVGALFLFLVHEQSD